MEIHGFVKRYQAMLISKNEQIASLKNDTFRLWKVIGELSEPLNVYSEQLKVQDEQLEVQDQKLKEFERLLRDIRHTAVLRDLYIKNLHKKHEMMEAENECKLTKEKKMRLDALEAYTAEITRLNAENATLRSQRIVTNEALKRAWETIDNVTNE